MDFLSVLRWAAFIDIIDSKLNAYENIAIGTANVFSIAQIIKVCVTFFLLYNVEKIQLYNKYAIILLKIMLLSLCVLPLFASDAVAGTRIRDLFGTVEFILFPLIVYLFKNMFQGQIILFLIGAMLFTISMFNLLIR